MPPRGCHEAEGHGFQRHAGIELDHKMQVRAVAVTGVSGIGDPLPAAYLCTLPDPQAVGLQMRIHGHGAVIMQYADLIGTGQVALLSGPHRENRLPYP